MNEHVVSWPNNHGFAWQHASDARRAVDGVVGMGADNPTGPRAKMALMLYAMHDYVLRNLGGEITASNHALQMAALYEELTGVSLIEERPDVHP